MNLGADVAPVNLTGTATGTPQAADSNGFAGVLGAMMQSAPVKVPEANLSPEQLLANQILMAKLANGEGELPQGQGQLANFLLPDGNALPEEGTEVNWSSMFGQYDSTDPDGAYMLSMEGDNDGHEISELSPEGLFQHTEQYTDGEQISRDVDMRHAAALLSERIEQARLQAAMHTGNSAGRGAAQSAALMGHDELTAVNPLGQIDGAEQLKPLSPEMLEANIADQQRFRPGLMSLEEHKKAASNGQFGAEQFKNDLNGLEMSSKLQSSPTATQLDLANLKADLAQNLGNIDNSAGGKVQPMTNPVGATASYAAVSGTSNSSAAQAGANVIANMTVPPENPGWGEVVGNRLQWMVNQKVQEAQIRLNPPELGMLDVKVQIGPDQQTNITFSSPHSQVRDALESAIPRLREMFGESGLNLGDVDVSHQSMSDQRQAEQGGEGENGAASQGGIANSGGLEPEDGQQMSSQSIQSDSMLDLYA